MIETRYLGRRSGRVLPIGGDVFKSFFIFFPVEENEAKEDARVPLDPARRRDGRSARKRASLKQSARFNPTAPSMLGAVQRETGIPKTIIPFIVPFERINLGSLPVYGRRIVICFINGSGRCHFATAIGEKDQRVRSG